jgi:SdrD B-like protein
MRALLVLVSLVATPFLAGVSQELQSNNGRGHDAAHCAKRVVQHPGREINKCATAPVDPPPPPPPAPGGGCVNSGPAGGTASIDGQVFSDAFPWPGLTDWCVELNGPVNATAVTDASGNYVFTGLPAGTYTVCEVVQAGWHQTFPTSGPSCANGLGWSITVMDGGGAGFVWFGNLTP